MFRIARLLTAFSCAACTASSQQPTFDQLAALFQNQAVPSLRAEVRQIPARSGARFFDLSFASPVNGRVPGVLITPDRSGRFPVLLFGHWMMEGSPLRNRNEFLEEAVVLARAGAICLLLDTPLVREGVKRDPDVMHGQEPLAAVQMTREWRRALDILLARSDVDPSRVAYVGHSFSAEVGAKLTAVEKRIQSFVLMANTYSLRDFVYDELNDAMLAWRKQFGEERVREYLQRFAFQDSLPFITHSAPAAVFVQNGRADAEIPERIVRASVARFQEPKRLQFYDAGHELNAAARRKKFIL